MNIDLDAGQRLQQEERHRREKALKKSAAPLALVKFTPTHVYHIFGYKFLFAYHISHMMTLPWMMGYINQHCFSRYGLFATFQTGNLIFLASSIDLRNNDTYPIYTNFPLLVVNMFVGVILTTALSCGCMEFFNDRKKSYLALSCCWTMAIIIVTMLDLFVAKTFIADADSINSKYNWPVLFLTLTASALVHWMTKQGFLVGLNTGNMWKLGEQLYKTLRNISLGGQKLRGDMVIISCIILSFFIGSLCSILWNATATDNSFNRNNPLGLVPLLIVIPLDVWAAGCVHDVLDMTYGLIDLVFHLHHDHDHPEHPENVERRSRAMSAAMGNDNIPASGQRAPSESSTNSGSTAASTGLQETLSSKVLVKQALGPRAVMKEQRSHYNSILDNHAMMDDHHGMDYGGYTGHDQARGSALAAGRSGSRAPSEGRGRSGKNRSPSTSVRASGQRPSSKERDEEAGVPNPVVRPDPIENKL